MICSGQRRSEPVSESGQVTAFVAIITAALLLVAGVVYDGGQLLAAQRRAINLAEAAARAGAQAIDEPTYRATGDLLLDPAEATRLASAHLAETGAQTGAGHTIQVNEPDQVTVSVTLTQPLVLLSVIGLDSQTVTGQATARAVPGIQEAVS